MRRRKTNKWHKFCRFCVIMSFCLNMFGGYTYFKDKFNSIVVERSYMDDKEKKTFKQTNSLRVHDLPRAAALLKKAYDFLEVKEMEIKAKE